MKKVFTFLSVFAAMTLSAQNLLENPSFEEGLAPWAKGPNSSYTEPTIVDGGAHDGSKYAEYTNATATTGFYQTIPVTAGEVYEITFWYKASGDDSDARLWSIFRNDDGGAVYTTDDASTDEFRTMNGYLETSSEWKMHTAKMPAGDGATKLEVAVRVYNGGSASFDGFWAGIEGTQMGTIDNDAFKKGVSMNTVVADKLVLNLPERSTVNIYTIEGKLVSSNRVDNGGSVSTQSLAKGVYIVTVSNGKSTVSQKIVKK